MSECITKTWFWIHKIYNKKNKSKSRIHKNNQTKHLKELEKGQSLRHLESGSMIWYSRVDPESHKAKNHVSPFANEVGP